MPHDPRFLPKDQCLPSEEIFRIAKELCGLGVEEIRLTGGEPLLRQDVVDIAERLSALPLKKFGLTTNGEHLGKVLPEFKKRTQLKNINISMDSLDPENFKRITGRGHLDVVLNALHQAVDLGFEVKVNVVLMRGKNDHEIEDFMNFSARSGVLVRFLELMRIGPNQEDFGPMLVSAADVVSKLETLTDLQNLPVPQDHTAFEVRCSNGAHLGFIASETQSFCSSCSRLRLTAKGELRPCLFKNEGVSLKGLSGEDLNRACWKVASGKPLERLPSVDQAMFAIGG
jgi:cyclic pyranopterin phosphate synthase